MNGIWIEMRLRIPAALIDLACNELSELGSDGITLEERQLDTFVPPNPDDPLIGTLEIKAYFPKPEDVEALRCQVQKNLSWLTQIDPGFVPELPEVRPVTNEDWAEGWKQHFNAVRIGTRLVIKPTWEEFQGEDTDVVVNIDPGMAFGTGTHGTTRLCLEALAKLFEEDAPKRVLDVGTGSGILAIAAAALGATEVLACDIDEESCRTATENALLNKVREKINITLDPLETLEGDFDIVLANILAEENIRLSEELVSRLKPGGALVLSGILREKEDMVMEAFSAYGLEGPHLSHLEDWACILYYKA